MIADDVMEREPQAYNDLGNRLKAQGRLAEAIDCYRRALEHDPDFAKAHSNLGNALQDQGDPEAAIACYGRAIALKPDFPEAYNNFGNALKALGRLDQAIACYCHAIALRDDIPELHCNLGLALARLGRLDEAIICYRRALVLRPDYPQAHNNLGAALTDLGGSDEAVACYRRAIALKPDFPEAYNNLGNALKERGQLGEAVDRYRRAIALNPLSPDVHNNLGTVLREQGETDQAVLCYLEALRLQPGFAEAYTNLGAALAQCGRLEEAMALYRRAIEVDPDLPEAHNNLGAALMQCGELVEAASCYRRAIALQPAYAGAHNNLAMALLALGDFAAGWAEHEWRWQTPQLTRARRHFAAPQWRGEAAAGRTLLIHAEQGLGDTLQFCRYATLAAERGFRVILQVQGPLVRLLRSLPGVELVVAHDAEVAAFDCHCPMLSLPLALGTTLSTVPGITPYLHADLTEIAVWRERLPPVDGVRRVGLAWAGHSRAHSPALAAVDARRSMPAHHLAPLFRVPGVQFVSLQKSGPAAPADYPLLDIMDEMQDFAATAALIANLDLVISVDTAVAHLAGALGKPVWLLDRSDPCWRWLAGRIDSPWYPTLSIYRQAKPGAWDSVMSEITQDLESKKSFASFPKEALPSLL